MQAIVTADGKWSVVIYTSWLVVSSVSLVVKVRVYRRCLLLTCQLHVLMEQVIWSEHTMHPNNILSSNPVSLSCRIFNPSMLNVHFSNLHRVTVTVPFKLSEISSLSWESLSRHALKATARVAGMCNGAGKDIRKLTTHGIAH